ncbi:MAG: hypothetical protein Ct9H300mP4_08910 [Gammaproteobacteria bacterium]|nr:MAG: hypothetical protein Ct9H300mP4_08910 [Gammaproteobacteria bacterium]
MLKLQKPTLSRLRKQKYIGIDDTENNQFIFRGIPYAKPPIGELRWKSPVPLSKEPKVINAQRFKPACMQDEYTTVWYQDVAELFGNPRTVFQHVDAVSEDCLYLNIWTNSLDQTSKKPVMVWVHGGADTGGWSYEPNYLGHHLASKNVVVVSINYRLNIFGFFAHPQMSNQTGNFGLKMKSWPCNGSKIISGVSEVILKTLPTLANRRWGSCFLPDCLPKGKGFLREESSKVVPTIYLIGLQKIRQRNRMKTQTILNALTYRP